MVPHGDAGKDRLLYTCPPSLALHVYSSVYAIRLLPRLTCRNICIDAHLEKLVRLEISENSFHRRIEINLQHDSLIENAKSQVDKAEVCKSLRDEAYVMNHQLTPS